MQRQPGSGGREKRVGSGGNNAYRRGSGIGGGPVGRGDGSGNRANGSRGSGGNGLLGLLLGLGVAAASGGGGNGKKKGGFNLKKLLIIILIIIVGYWLLKQCSANNDLSNQFQNNDNNATIESAFGNSGSSSQPSSEAESVLDSENEAENIDYNVSNKARDKYTTIRGGGDDSFTIMVYMCGTDLESNYGMATADLNEMLHSDLSDKINIIVETGGTKKWKNSVISSRTNQIYQVKDGEFVCLEKDLGSAAMTNPNTLSAFIKYCSENFPADRSALILWDHGGGSLTGYGYDQNYAGTSMALDKINKALKDGGCKFDFIGFDACLMANYETAIVAERYADYLIASEETEPGCGWYYTNWLSKLSKNTSMPTVQIGKNIIDDFISASAQQAPGSATTLSIVDLAEMSGTVPEAFNSFAKDASSMLDSDDYELISNARSDAREFAESSNINQIDLIDLCEHIGTDPSKSLSEALRSCVKYNKHSSGMSRSNGLSIYFPYGKLSSVNEALDLYSSIDMDESYTDCIRSFASLTAGGQISSGSSSSPLTTLFGSDSSYADLLGSVLGSGNVSSGTSGSYGQTTSLSGSSILTSVLESYLSGGSGSSSSSSAAGALGSLLGGGSSYGNSSSDYGNGYSSILSAMLGGKGGMTDWLDTDRMLRSASYYDENRIDASQLVPTKKNGGYVLKLTDEQWDLIQNIELNVFLDDGEGYIDLGMDNSYTWDDDLDLVMDYDHTWIALNGQIVSYYMIDETRNDDGSYLINGRVPALLNGEQVELMLQFTNEEPYGKVLGAKKLYSLDETSALAKGLIELQNGDKLDFLCDYYDYNGEYQDSYMLGERMTVNGDLEISNVDLGDHPCKVSYCLSDIYNNRYWTASLDQ